MEIAIDCPVTNIKLLREDPNRVILAGMNGCAHLSLSYAEILELIRINARSSIGIYDLRFPLSSSLARALSKPTSASPRPSSNPIMSLKGHYNSFSTDLGFDTYRDEFLIAGSPFSPFLHLARPRTNHSLRIQLVRIIDSACGPSEQVSSSSLPPLLPHPPLLLPAIHSPLRSFLLSLRSPQNLEQLHQLHHGGNYLNPQSRLSNFLNWMRRRVRSGREGGRWRRAKEGEGVR